MKITRYEESGNIFINFTFFRKEIVIIISNRDQKKGKVFKMEKHST